MTTRSLTAQHDLVLGTMTIDEATATLTSVDIPELTVSELARYEALAQPADRVRFLAAHGLARVVVAARHRVDPTDVELVYEPGKPPSARWEDGTARVSWAHTSGAVACLAASAPCGVDIEPLDRLRDVNRLAREAMHPAERAEIQGLAPDAATRRFLTSWTLKEALGKALGEGFAGARGRRLLQECGFFSSDAGIRVHAANGLVTTPFAAALLADLTAHLGAVVVFGADALAGTWQQYELVDGAGLERFRSTVSTALKLARVSRLEPPAS